MLKDSFISVVDKIKASRIKSILSFKKPAVGLSAAAIALAVLVGDIYLTNGVSADHQDKIDSDRVWYESYEKDGEDPERLDGFKTDYNKVKVKYISEMMGFKHANEFETSEPKFVADIDSMLKSAKSHEGETPDLSNNGIIKKYIIELSSESGGYACQLFYDTLYDKAYLGKDGGLHYIGTDFARYADSLLENPNISANMDNNAVALFKQYGWTLDYKINSMKLKLNDIESFSGFDSNSYYFAYNNELSKDIGLDISKYAGSNVDVEIYRIREGMPPVSNPNKNTRGIVVKNQSGIIGAFISAGRHSVFSACSLKSNGFEQIAGVLFNEWLEGKITAGAGEQRLAKLSPEQVIEEYFQALGKKDSKRAEACISKQTMLENLTTNMLNHRLYNEMISLPLTCADIHESKDPFSNLKSAALLKTDLLKNAETDENHKTYRVTVNLAYVNENIISSGVQFWGCSMVYETPQTGWKIVGFGQG